MKQLKQKLLLMTVSLLCAITVSASANTHFEVRNSDGIIYYCQLISDQEAVQIYCMKKGNQSDAWPRKFIFPSSVEYNKKEYPVVSIGASGSASGNIYAGDGIEEIVIPNSVISIGNSAFYQCDGLKSITIPNSVTRIGRSAFNGCWGLTSIVIPNSVTNIDDSAFASCI